jgi:uncharacterized membrane protein
MKRLPRPAGLLVAAALVSTGPVLAAAAVAAPAASAVAVAAQHTTTVSPDNLIWD